MEECKENPIVTERAIPPVSDTFNCKKCGYGFKYRCKLVKHEAADNCNGIPRRKRAPNKPKGDKVTENFKKEMDGIGERVKLMTQESDNLKGRAELAVRETELNGWESALHDREIDLANKEAELGHMENDLNRREAELYDKEIKSATGLDDREAALIDREKAVSKMESYNNYQKINRYAYIRKNKD